MEGELQHIYKQQVFRVIGTLAKAYNEAIILRGYSHDGTWEKKESDNMVEDLRLWLRCWKEYAEHIYKALP